MTNLTESGHITELLFFAYRDFTKDADKILDDIGLGRAHHRALHFIDRQPNLSVAELLELLGVTKQSLSRVLRNLVDAGYVRQNRSTQDGRRQELSLSSTGEELILKLRAPQYRRIADALSDYEQDAQIVIRFLEGMLDETSMAQQNALSKIGDHK
ncbi:MAG: MarR family transcriptional regulator [Pseudomonadota bacterium]